MKLEISKIRPDASNQRSTGKDISELAESMSQYGLLQPIGITSQVDEDGLHTIIYGHRRFEAAKSLNWDLIDVNIIENVHDTDFKAIQLSENIHRADIHPMDEARTIAELVDVQMETQKYVAQLLGKSVPYIRKRKALNDLIEPIQEAFIRGNINISMALKLAMLHRDVQMEIYNDNEDEFIEEGNTFESEWAVERELNRLGFYKFDKTECNTCPFNSAVNELFPTEDAMCGNPSCLEKKKDAYNASLIEEAKTKVAYFIYDGSGTPSAEKQAIGDKLTAEGYTVLWKQRSFTQVEQPDVEDYTEGEADPEYIEQLQQFKNSFKAFDFNGMEYTDIVLELDEDTLTAPSNVGTKEITPEEQRKKVESVIVAVQNDFERTLSNAKSSFILEVADEIGRLGEEVIIAILKQHNPEKFLELEGEYLSDVEKLQKSHEIKLNELRSKL